MHDPSYPKHENASDSNELIRIASGLTELVLSDILIDA